MGQHDLTCEAQGGEIASGNIFIRHVRLVGIGQVLPGHQHHFPHTTFVTRGGIHVLASPDKALMDELVRHGPQFAPFGCECGEASAPRQALADLMGREWKVGTFATGQHFLVEKGWFHRITATTGGGADFSCIYSHRDPQGDVVQWDDGWRADVHGHYQ